MISDQEKEVTKLLHFKYSFTKRLVSVRIFASTIIVRGVRALTYVSGSLYWLLPSTPHMGFDKTKHHIDKHRTQYRVYSTVNVIAHRFSAYSYLPKLYSALCPSLDRVSLTLQIG